MSWTKETSYDAMVPLGKAWLRASEVSTVVDLGPNTTASRSIIVTMRNGSEHQGAVLNVKDFVRQVMGIKTTKADQ